jgi:nucleotide-binding universal stress UspA family protein
MSPVLAALDNSVAAGPVLAAAQAYARLLGASVEAVHVRTDGERTARLAAEAAGVALTELDGDPVKQLVRAGSKEDVVCIVLGARATPGGARPAGATALAVAAELPKPVLLVPPDAPRPGRLDRVLVPLEGTVSSSLAPRAVIELAAREHVDLVVLHVLDEASIPAFTDQPQHETQAWAREFLARYCPWGAETISFESRVGRPDELIARAAGTTGADLVALGWSQELAAGRAPVVRAVLERARVPLLLVPVLITTESRTSVTSV